MTDQNYGDFIVKIIETLKKNGYPENHVSLPLEKMYEVAHSKGLNFNKVLEFLESKEKISHRKTDEKIVFYPESSEAPVANFDFADLASKMGPMSGENPADFLKKAQDIFKTLPPDQLKGMMDMFNSMSDEQKEDIIKKGKDMGIVP